MDDLIVEINQALRDNASKAELREILKDVRNVLSIAANRIKETKETLEQHREY